MNDTTGLLEEDEKALWDQIVLMRMKQEYPFDHAVMTANQVIAARRCAPYKAVKSGGL